MKTIQIFVWHGSVTEVRNLPQDCMYEIIDFDADPDYFIEETEKDRSGVEE